MTVTFVDADVSIARRIRGSTSRLSFFFSFSFFFFFNTLRVRSRDLDGLRQRRKSPIFWLYFFLLFRLVFDNRWTRPFPKFQWNRVCSVLVTPRVDLFSYTAVYKRRMVSLHVLTCMYL